METPKRLGAVTVTANTNKLLYTVPGSTSTIVSSVCICNRGVTSATFRVAHVAGAIGNVQQGDYIYYDATIAPNDTYVLTIGAAMSATHTLLVRSNSASVNFVAW
jgi:hypothetical protein